MPELDPAPTPASEMSGTGNATPPTPGPSFPIVAVGASAGGLEAFTHLLKHLPADTGMGFVFVQHLSPWHSSLLVSILARSTTMPVTEVQQDTPVEPNHIYVIPPNALMRISGRILELAPRSDERGAPRPIDYLFLSLADDCQALAIGVLLSGADADGANGLQAIREQGGIAIAQSEVSAKNPEMPRAAIAAGTVDLVLSPEEIGAELARIARHPDLPLESFSSEPAAPPETGIPLTHLFQLLRGATGIDFSGYKPGTLRRRIARRMLLKRRENFASWLSSLESDPAELLALSEDLLIHVTSFFRDPDAFEAFEKSILPQILKKTPDHKGSDNTPFRVWVPGCSTGQEVYSIAICLVEALSSGPARFLMQIPVQIFGTDLSEKAIATARGGIYSEREIAKLSPERQARFFVRCEGGLQIVKSIREMCVFARQNLLADPPFSRLHLISCRNVLIYLGQAMQHRIVATFHYALQSEGILWLGTSESLREFPELFTQIDKRHKFYATKHSRDRIANQIIGRGIHRDSAPPSAALVLEKELLLEKERTPAAPLERAVERLVLSEFGPAWVLVNENFEILSSMGDVGQYLQLPPGQATLSLPRLARDEIRGELTRLLNRARLSAGSETADTDRATATVLSREPQGAIAETRLQVRRITASARRAPSDPVQLAFLVIFLPAAYDPSRSRAALVDGFAAEFIQEPAPDAGKPGPRALERLRHELILSNQRLQAILIERDAANHELISANEEIQSSNEELQSINEELETSKEELQSSNEELNTVNDELQNRNQELVRLSDDLANLLSSTTIPILMLDNELRIRRVTPTAERLLNVRQSDVGRPIGDLRLPLSEKDLDSLIRRVIDTLAGEEVEVRDRDGKWHLLRVRPYRTGDNRIEGAVLTMIDIDQIRRARNAADAAREFAESLIDSVQTPLLVLQRDLRVRTANRAFLAAYGLRRAEVENHPLNALGESLKPSADSTTPGQWDSPDLIAALARLSRGESASEDLELEQDVPVSGRRILLVNARQVQQDGEFQILLAANDITAQRSAESIMRAEQERLRKNFQSTAKELEQAESALHGSEDALQRSREELRALTGSLLNAQDEERRRVSRELHDDVSQNMAKLQFDIETLEQSLPAERDAEKKRLLLIRDNAAQLSDDLKKIAYGLHPSTLDHLGLTVALRAYGREFSKRTGIRLKFDTANVPAQLPQPVASAFYRIAQEALRNVAKHAPDAQVVIQLDGDAAGLTLTITDDGPGFDPAAVRGKGGLGLVSMEERARLVHAAFHLKTQPGLGASITISAPLPE